MKIILKSKSSHSHYYNVTFDFSDGKVRILCDCPHGDWKRVCRHRLAMINGDKSILFDKKQADQLDAVLKALRQPGFDGELISYYKRLQLIEKQKSKRDDLVRQVNYDFGQKLNEGISVAVN
ncbi:MAG: hypothetical protein J0L62_13260 [Bacteroidetes bacterium]|nr:hypothetical protein [Bacteroidota bacterium]